MGNAAVQGELWGARARNWADVQEPTWRRVYETLFSRAVLDRGTKLLDVGCGAGGALLIAHERNAELAGLDGSHNLVAIARERLPHAGIEAGEMEELPFPDSAFDLATSFNAFQFAGNSSRPCEKHGAW